MENDNQTKNNLIQIINGEKYYTLGGHQVVALNKVNLEVKEGEFIALMGPSGSGKSTMMNMLGLLDNLDNGQYLLNGKEIKGLGESEITVIRSQTIGFIFQQFNLLSRTNGIENVYMPHFYLSYEEEGKNHDYYVKRAKDLLDAVGLGKRKYHAPNELSGGQQQRVAIARSLMNDPKIILADEPTGNLDTKSGNEIMAMLHELNNLGKTILLVTHEEDIALFAKRIIRMKDGNILEDKINNNRTIPDIKEEEKALLNCVYDRVDFTKTHNKNYFKVLFSYIGHAFKAISSNYTRSFLSMLGILIGVGSVIAMQGLGRGAKEAINESMKSLGTNIIMVRSGSSKVRGIQQDASEVTQLTPEDVNEIRKIEGVKDVATTVSSRVSLTYQNKNYSTQLMGVSDTYKTMREIDAQVGRSFTKEENNLKSMVAILGPVPWMELFEGKNPIGEMIKINKLSFRVIGVLPNKGTSPFQDPGDMIIIPINTAMKRLLGKKNFDSIDVQAINGDTISDLEEKIRDAIIKVHNLPPHKYDTFRIMNFAEMLKTSQEMTKTLTLLLASIASISLIVGGIGIMNIMLVSVTERTREIGLRKALGAKKIDILGQFLIESVVVSGLGGFLGILFGSSIIYAFRYFAKWSAGLEVMDILISCIFSSVIGLIFGIWPAYSAASKKPIEALRYE